MGDGNEKKRPFPRALSRRLLRHLDRQGITALRRGADPDLDPEELAALEREAALDDPFRDDGSRPMDPRRPWHRPEGWPRRDGQGRWRFPGDYRANH